MLGLMQDVPLTTSAIFGRAVRFWGERTIVTATAAGKERVTFAEFADRVRRLAEGLDALRLSVDARVGTFGWNTEHHLQLYFAVPGTGRVLHTINIRYFADQIRYCVNHAEDEAIFVDRSLGPALAPLLAEMPTVRHVVVMPDGSDAELPADPRVLDFDELVSGCGGIEFGDRVRDENQASGLCYTTGTTGDPKGVLYSHRSTWLHANAHLSAAGMRITDTDTVMPVVPMFHAMAWGLPYSSVLAGASLAMPGSDLSPAGLLDLIESERVTYTAGVPTIWMGMLPLLQDREVSSLNRILGGGSAVPPALNAAWQKATGMPITQGWGMTESSPVGAVATFRQEVAEGDADLQASIGATQGMPLVGIEARIVDPTTGEALPWDDTATGELQTHGPWVARQYYGSAEPGEQFTEDGWLRTGDVAAISPLGYVRLVDRTKDLIKSGGEWISSIDLENLIMTHPDVLEAAVIAVPDPKWMERPLACVVPRAGRELSAEEVLGFLAERIARWQLPDDVVFLEEIPKTSVGKFSKKDLRNRFAGLRLGS
jgi:fatty-acyl-CoA synthase